MAVKDAVPPNDKTAGNGNEIGAVGWGRPSSERALYGSWLTMDESGAAHFVNPLLPSGTTIQEWFSFLDYQAERESPALPLLHQGNTYRIVPDVVSVPDDAFIIEVRFFDRFDALVGAEVLYAPKYEFEYPPDGHYYTIRLVNAGCDEIHFVSMSLLEVGEDG